MQAPQARFWAPYSPLVLAPFQQRRHTGELWVWLGLLLLVILVATAAGISSGWHAARLTLGIATVPAWVVLWCISFSSLRQQNHPHAARLVPGHLARLRRCAVGLLVALTFLVTALYAPFTGQPLLWALGAATTLVSLAVCMRWAWLWIVLAIVPSFGWWWPLNQITQVLWAGLKQWYLLQPLSLAVLAVLVLPWVLSRLLQEGDAEHRRSYSRQEQMRQRLSQAQQSMTPSKHTGRLATLMMNVFAWPQPLWRDYLLRHAQPTARSALARAELVSLAGLHWTGILGALSVLALVLAAVALGVQLRYQPDWSEIGRNGNYGLQIGIVCSALNPLLGLSATLYRSRREQALLMLLPGMPQGQALRRLMAQRLLLQFYVQWCLALVVVAAVSSLGGEPLYARLGFYALLGVLPMGSLLLRDWSRQGLASASAIALLVLVSVLASALIFGLVWFGMSVGAVAVASVLLTASLLRWRWRRYIASGLSPMPVGRWA